MIPKIIHQTYPRTRVPPVIARNIEHLRAMNAGWRYRFYDDDAIAAFIGRHYDKRVNAAYHSIAPHYGAARADLFRYLLLYAVGGVYLDIKSSTSKPLDGVLHGDDSYVLAQWPNGPGAKYPELGCYPELAVKRGEFQQWHVIAEPGHPFLKAVIDAVLRNIAAYDPERDGVGKMGVLRLTGPIAYTRAIVPQLCEAPHRLVHSHRNLGLVYSVLLGKGTGAHEKLFASHYSQRTDPVVVPASAHLPAGAQEDIAP